MLHARRAAVIKSCAAAPPAPTIGIMSPVASAPGAGNGLTPSGGLAGLGLSPSVSPSSPAPSAASVQVWWQPGEPPFCAADAPRSAHHCIVIDWHSDLSRDCL